MATSTSGTRTRWTGALMAGRVAIPFASSLAQGVIFDNTFTNYGATNVVVDERRGSGEETSGTLLACDGTHDWDGDYGDSNAPGWPCLGQIGRGTGNTTGNLGAQPSVPLLLWSNGSQAGCAMGGSCTNTYSVSVASSGGPRPDSAYVSSTAHTSMGAGKPGYGDVDYCEGSTMPTTCGTYTNSYVPYPYPHPLQGGAAGSDGGTTGPDGGPSGSDGGTAGTDSGIGLADGAAPPDSGSLGADGGGSGLDGGIKAADAGRDGSALPDAGATGATSTGCSCVVCTGATSGVYGAVAPWLMAAAAWYRRRRRKPRSARCRAMHTRCWWPTSECEGARARSARARAHEPCPAPGCRKT